MSDLKFLGEVLKRDVTYELPEHQVLLSFNDDQHALVFDEWLSLNWQDFVEYYEKGPKE